MIDGSSRRIQVLRDSVARQIAAGEVIDRPFSVVRELLDNSIDAGATSIDVYIEAGGVASVRVVDNGRGMDREDLELCWKSHATSKISSVEDLDHLMSLGFRGEALSSIAACSRLTITTRTAVEPTAYRLKVESGKLVSLDEAPGEAGTVVEVADLFYSLPARRKFLKTPSAETAMCRSLLVEKSLAFPHIAFRLFSGGSMKVYLPGVETLDERIASAHPSVVTPELIHRTETRSERYSITVVMGGPSLYRKDRRYIWTYVNNRKISEYALIQAVEYGFGDRIPGGYHPVAFVFISIDPELVDFNVHPAKREARFRNLPEIHHGLVVALKEYLQRFATSYRARPETTSDPGGELPLEGSPVSHAGSSSPFPGTPQPAPRGSSGVNAPRSTGFPGAPPQPPKPFPGQSTSGPGFPPSRRLPAEVSELRHELAPRPAPTEAEGIRYFGQVFDLFLIASVEERLFLIDQHAAHERILFERFRSNPGKPQNLLLPIRFEATNDEELLLKENAAFCSEVGIDIERLESGEWEVRSLPEGFHSLEEEIVAFVKQAKGTRRELEQELYARMSCRAAVKEGDSIDEVTAVELIKQAFALDHARCPHGRPIWYELSRTELYRLVGRL